MQISIREWDEDDALILHSLSKHPFLSRKRLFKFFYPDTFLNAMSTIFFYQNADPKRFLYRAILKDGEVVGCISAQIKNESSCELTYWLGVKYWNQGIMSKAVPLICKEIFQRLPVVCIYAVVDQKNIASQKVLEHHHFNKERMEHLFIYRCYK